ncbi:glycoside hydrolase superfamily [Naematelia encephala]|uniref:Glycoside hydrolase superfamily n=1 Tax=Naematelia encephala TaxID=71784 RepID=A0A1Y2BDK3_9TREE|nr:glycoside hydrolase superfamily [Naematelia encephala]
MLPHAVIATATALALAGSVRGLSSWYTAPGGTPAGSTTGDKIRGVNLGGWFILENWMMPDFFSVSPLDQYNVPDEWTYCSILGKDECLSRLEEHWDTYVTEDDFRRMANYSMNAVRIPMGYWAWTGLEDFEPYVQSQKPYLERALNWSSYYGLDVMLDLHGLPGGQNGQDNQGIKGPIEFANNATNLQRAIDALANMTAFVTQDKFEGVVKAIELTNEPYILEYSSAGMDFYSLAEFYVQGYAAVRANEYIQPGENEVMVVIHDAFQPLMNWEYFWSEPSLGLNWTNYALDTHIYGAFGSSADQTEQEHLDAICSQSSAIAAAQLKFPVIVGEFSLGTNTYCVDYQSCWGQNLAETIANLTDYDTSLFLRQFWEVQADVYELSAGWIFWSANNQLGAPWSWSQSAAQNWIPEDPTERLYPFNASVSSYCLDTANPLAGDQNWPYFPGYANNISSLAQYFSKQSYASAQAAAVAAIPDTNTSSSSSVASTSASIVASISSASSSVAASTSTSTSDAASQINTGLSAVLLALMCVAVVGLGLV